MTASPSPLRNLVSDIDTARKRSEQRQAANAKVALGTTLLTSGLMTMLEHKNTKAYAGLMIFGGVLGIVIGVNKFREAE